MSPSFDPSTQAAKVLDSVLKVEETESESEQEVPQASIHDVRTGTRVAQPQSSRSQSRVLFVTTDVSILREGTPLRQHIETIAPGFEEIHVMVLASIYEAKKGVSRVSTNVWLYTTGSKYAWAQVFEALSVVRHQLLFAEGFRPDVVVALDAVLSGVVGLEIARTYDRAFQLHVSYDIFSSAAKAVLRLPWWQRIAISYVLKRTMSVRVATQALRAHIQSLMPHTTDIAVLPKHFDIARLTSQHEATPDPFAQFSFVILFVGELTHESTLFRAIDAARSALFSPRIGLVVLGSGPAQSEFETRAEILGVKKGIVFVKDTSLLHTYMAHADVLLCTDTHEESDALVVKAAACGLPVIMAQNGFRTDVFTDGTDAFLCPFDDTVCFSQKLIKFLNTVSLRTQFSENAKSVVISRLSSDPAEYIRAYQASIEGVFAHTTD